MKYFELEKRQQEESRKRLMCYEGKNETLKEKKKKEAEVNVKAQNICRGRSQRHKRLSSILL